MNSMILYPWFCLPFLAVLLSVAILPTLAPRFWKKFHFLILSMFAIPSLLLTFSYNPHWVLHTLVDYINFILLLGTLYKIGGGLYVTGTPKANPLTNIGYMLVGALLANFIGTLGASMLLIRPLLRSNRGRKNEKHVVLFFIFIVCNCAGMLTPLGDPPLLYGYLAGVPFWWAFKLFPVWMFIITALIAIFAAVDAFFFLNDPDFRGPLKSEIKEPFKILGRWNLVLALLTIAAMVVPQMLHLPNNTWRLALRMFMLIGILEMSNVLTPKQIVSLNNFSWEPFREVMNVFAAIFATMTLTTKYLESIAPHIEKQLNPWVFYWLTGGLSAFLDNAPTYASMLSLATALPESFPIVRLASGATINEMYLMAISVASVCFGALTYIGNAPNLLIKSVAESEGFETPSFIGYFIRAFLFLVPVFLVAGLLFFL